MASAEISEQVRRAFRRSFSGTPRVVRAPGRVNLIGEHTDYNDGFVLPAALDLASYMAFAARDDRTVRVHSLLTGQTATFDLDEGMPKPRKDWSDYVRGVAIALAEDGHRLRGADAIIGSDVPPGAGLSSSAALEVAAGYAFLTVTGEAVDRTALALACQRAENDFVGARVGIMDQFVACHGLAGHAVLIDCRSLKGRPVAIDASARLLICNTMVHHQHAGGAYNQRRRECEEGVKRLSVALDNIRALRDVTEEQLARYADLLTPIVHRRCRHVVTENDRTLRAAAALAEGDLVLCGRLMIESQASMRDDFEISCREVDIMVEANLAVDGVYGSRMTGGGFGGCTISLVDAAAVDRFKRHVAATYRAGTGIEPQIFVCSPADGVGMLD